MGAIEHTFLKLLSFQCHTAVALGIMRKHLSSPLSLRSLSLILNGRYVLQFRHVLGLSEKSLFSGNKRWSCSAYNFIFLFEKCARSQAF